MGKTLHVLMNTLLLHGESAGSPCTLLRWEKPQRLSDGSSWSLPAGQRRAEGSRDFGGGTLKISIAKPGLGWGFRHSCAQPLGISVTWAKLCLAHPHHRSPSCSTGPQLLLTLNWGQMTTMEALETAAQSHSTPNPPRFKDLTKYGFLS